MPAPYETTTFTSCTYQKHECRYSTPAPPNANDSKSIAPRLVSRGSTKRSNGSLFYFYIFNVFTPSIYIFEERLGRESGAWNRCDLGILLIVCSDMCSEIKTAVLLPTKFAAMAARAGLWARAQMSASGVLQCCFFQTKIPTCKFWKCFIFMLVQVCQFHFLLFKVHATFLYRFMFDGQLRREPSDEGWRDESVLQRGP